MQALGSESSLVRLEGLLECVRGEMDVRLQEAGGMEGVSALAKEVLLAATRHLAQANADRHEAHQPPTLHFPALPSDQVTALEACCGVALCAGAEKGGGVLVAGRRAACF